MVFDVVVVDGTFSRPLFRFKGGNSDGFSSKSGRFVSLAGVAGGDDESVDGGEEGDCRCFFRQSSGYATRLFGSVYITLARPFPTFKPFYSPSSPSSPSQKHILLNRSQ